MRRPLTRKLFFLAIQAVTALPAQTRGTITATVVDRAGQPVAGARVAVVPAGAHGIMGLIPECLTDDKGVCSQDLQFGKYNVTARKTAEGYPDLLANFYGQGQWPATAEISLVRPAASVTVRLGPKAGLLAIHVVDDASGEPLKQVNVTLRPAADPHDFSSEGLGGPDCTILIPPDEDVLVTVSANGYQPWHLEEHPGISQGGVVRLHSEGRQEITVRLKH